MTRFESRMSALGRFAPLVERIEDRLPRVQTLSFGDSAETYFPNWAIIRHVADFLESTLRFADRNLPRARGRPVYFGKQPVRERALGRLLVTQSGRWHWLRKSSDSSREETRHLTKLATIYRYRRYSTILVIRHFCAGHGCC